MKNGILIITGSDEPNVPDVITHLTDERVVRLNTNLLNTSTMSLEIEGDKIEVALNCDGQTLTSSEIKSIWCRRPPPASLQATGLSELDQKFAESENQRFFRALWNSFPSEGVTWLNHPLATYRVEHNKPLQLQTAHQAGLMTPTTLITSDLNKAREFVANSTERTIFKTFSSYSRDEDGRPVGVYTTTISKEQLENFGHELKFAPVIFQRYVPKKFELRITVIGKRVFACAIHSQSSQRTKDDWRRYDFQNVVHEPHQLPTPIEQSLLACMRSWGLQFGTIDMVVTPSGEYVFLEINPSGHWGWIEVLTGMPISKSLAELLINPTRYAL